MSHHRSFSAWGRPLLLAASCCGLCLVAILGCRSSSREKSEQGTVQASDVEAQVEASASTSGSESADPPEEESRAPVGDYEYYDLPLSPEGYRLLEERDRREPRPGHAGIPDLPPDEQERAAQTVKTAQEFVEKLEAIHPFDYCRAAQKMAPKDAWGSKFSASCRAKFMGIWLRSAGPDRIERSEDDIVYGLTIGRSKSREYLNDLVGTF